ncbi:MAG: hypothetical protein U9O78_00195 [Patescibacteria group bacterium]|nr:hypothetical protein [Patescibacteria group bacterium]
MKDINFLSKKNRKLSEKAQQDKKNFRYVAIFSSVVILVSLLVFGANLYLQFKNKDLKTQIRSTSNKVAKREPLEAEYLFFIDKLKVIRALFEMRSDKQVAINFFTNLFGPNIDISGINYEMKEGILSLTVTSPHIFYLEDALKTLEDPIILQRFKTFAKSNLERGEDGSYSFDLTITLQENSELIKETDPLDEES